MLRGDSSTVVPKFPANRSTASGAGDAWCEQRNLLPAVSTTAMDETSALMKKAHAAHEHGIVLEDDSSWGGTPELRKLWSNKLFKPKLTAEVSSDANYGSYEEELGIGGISRQPSVDELDNTLVDVEPHSTSDGLIDKMRGVASHCMVGTPGLIIALVLNLFLSMSFGQAFFPTSWQFPVGIPRAIGVQMFLFSTLVSQLVMTAMSEFPTAMGMMMVENIPFMHIIAQIAVKQQGPGIETFSTVFVTFALSTIVVGVAFYILGAFKIGNAVYFFPRHVIIGCIGGIGIFIIQTGVEVSCDRSWEWSLTSIAAFAQTSVAVHWLASLAFVALLRILLAVFNAPLLPPFYFVAIPPAFYLLLLVCGITQLQAREQNWFFPAAENVDPLLIWELIDFRVVNWKAVGDCIPTIIALSLFSLMHVPINIPSLSISTRHDVDMNHELIAHGYSNLLAGALGGLQNYLCYSNSLLYYKCKGGGKISGYLMSAITAVFFVLGPSVVYYMPRVMPGCLLIHIGIDLATEALVDSWGACDAIEYSSVVAITVVMTFYGMTAGLGLGVLCAAMTFTIQASWKVYPIRGKMCGRTLRSSCWRSAAEAVTLDRYTRHIVAIQLQGHIFFGNATLLAAEVERMLLQSLTSEHIWFIVLDFTLVVGIDSSAAETILKIYKLCRRCNVRLCYCAGAETGFPCSFPLSDSIAGLDEETIKFTPGSCARCGASFTIAGGKCGACGRKETFTRLKWVCQSNSLDGALAWCEDVILGEARSGARPGCVYGSSSSANVLSSHSAGNGKAKGASPSKAHEHPVVEIPADVPIYLHQIYNLSRSEPRQKIDKLMSYFVRDYVDRGTVLWIQGAASDRALLLVSGRLQHLLEEEAETIEMVYPGHLVGEYGLLNQQIRAGTLTAIEDCELLVLHQDSFDAMARNDPYLALVFSKICMAYLGRRVMHVANRIWESHCLPV